MSSKTTKAQRLPKHATVEDCNTDSDNPGKSPPNTTSRNTTMPVDANPFAAPDGKAEVEDESFVTLASADSAKMMPNPKLSNKTPLVIPIRPASTTVPSMPPPSEIPTKSGRSKSPTKHKHSKSGSSKQYREPRRPTGTYEQQNHAPEHVLRPHDPVEQVHGRDQNWPLERTMTHDHPTYPEHGYIGDHDRPSRDPRYDSFAPMHPGYHEDEPRFIQDYRMHRSSRPLSVHVHSSPRLWSPQRHQPHPQDRYYQEAPPPFPEDYQYGRDPYGHALPSMRQSLVMTSPPRNPLRRAYTDVYSSRPIDYCPAFANDDPLRNSHPYETLPHTRHYSTAEDHYREAPSPRDYGQSPDVRHRSHHQSRDCSTMDPHLYPSSPRPQRRDSHRVRERATIDTEGDRTYDHSESSAERPTRGSRRPSIATHSRRQSRTVHSPARASRYDHIMSPTRVPNFSKPGTNRSNDRAVDQTEDRSSRRRSKAVSPGPRTDKLDDAVNYQSAVRGGPDTDQLAETRHRTYSQSASKPALAIRRPSLKSGTSARSRTSRHGQPSVDLGSASSGRGYKVDVIVSIDGRPAETTTMYRQEGDGPLHFAVQPKLTHRRGTSTTISSSIGSMMRSVGRSRTGTTSDLSGEGRPSKRETKIIEEPRSERDQARRESRHRRRDD